MNTNHCCAIGAESALCWGAKGRGLVYTVFVCSYSTIAFNCKGKSSPFELSAAWNDVYALGFVAQCTLGFVAQCALGSLGSVRTWFFLWHALASVVCFGCAPWKGSCGFGAGNSISLASILSQSVYTTDLAKNTFYFPDPTFMQFTSNGWRWISHGFIFSTKQSLSVIIQEKKTAYTVIKEN